MADTLKLPRWQSHKIVHAAKILRRDGDDITLLIPGSAEQENSSMVVKAANNMFARYTPVAGDYYVVYDDGYASISPRQAFEEGYHQL